MDTEIARAGLEVPTSPESAAVFETYRDRIYRYVLRLVRHPAEAEDLAQETFLRAHRQLGSLQDRGALKVWLYRIATRLCYDRFREPSYRLFPQSLDAAFAEPSGQVETQWADPDAPTPDRTAAQLEMSACVQDLVEKLPAHYRTVILLHDVEGLTNPEIAQILDCSLDAVKIRLHRARRMLRATLTAACEFSRDERGVFVCEPVPATADS